jgi:(1->4)-alpha-D-glucan 1-alpha-D-glucosylmutase
MWAAGPKAASLVAYQRGEDVIVAVPRLLMNAGNWEDTYLDFPEGPWTDRLTGESVQGGRIEAGALLKRFPVALLTRGAAK